MKNQPCLIKSRKRTKEKISVQKREWTETNKFIIPPMQCISELQEILELHLELDSLS